jgi:sulfite reductase (NADPH) hemoprotein beta-component/sulfite reductase (ferredoxin)
MIIRNLKGENIEEIKKLNPKGETAFYNSVACIGSTICNLGVVNSPVLLESINNRFKNKESVAKVLPTLRISGCPNSCGAHPVAKLGFWGRKKNGEDYYNVVARGEFQGKVIKLNQTVGELKASIIPEFLERLGNILIKDGKDFDQFLEDGNRLEDLIGEYQE